MDGQCVSIARAGRSGPVRSPGRRRLLARGVWHAVLALTLAIAAASFPAYLAPLRTPCDGGACGYQQLTPVQVAALAGVGVGLSLGGYGVLTLALLLDDLPVCWGGSALIVWRRPEERMALLVALLLVALGPLTEAIALGTVGSNLWRAPYTYLALFTLGLLVPVFLLFPSGRFAPRWTRVAFVALLVGAVPAFLLPNALLLPYTPSSQLSWLVAVGALVFVGGVRLYRYRRVSSPLERQQTNWVVVGRAVPITAYIGLTALALAFTALAASSAAYMLVFNERGCLLALCLPLAFGFALLRYRLRDIDTLISRALVYGALTAILTLVYSVGVIGGQTVVGSFMHAGGEEQSPLIVLVTTLVIAALFQPLRRRIQATVDRRFYRSKYDVTRTLAACGATLRSQVGLAQFSDHLLAVVEDTMQPRFVSLCLAAPAAPDAAGTPRGPARRLRWVVVGNEVRAR